METLNKSRYLNLYGIFTIIVTVMKFKAMYS